VAIAWESFQDALCPVSITYIRYEAVASLKRQVEPLLVPGILQTEAYTRALLSCEAFECPPARVERILESRRKRQETVLTGPPMSIVLGEAVLAQEVGGRAVMREQRERIRDLNDLDHLSVKVLPYRAGAHRGLGGSFVLLELPDSGSSGMVLYEEYRRGGRITTRDTERIADFHTQFCEMESLATDLGDFLPARTEHPEEAS
jgi:Domain of unknown function (DUF5753)